jgi:tetratricopeptide (TPR) repeat protein
VQLIFYRKNGLGIPRLYSPNVDTIRALLLPEAATVHLFGPNGTMNEATIRTSLRVPPAEDEVITAAASVASGIKDIGNDEILGRLASPRAMLARELTPRVRSHFISGVPKVTSVLMPSAYGGVQADLSIEAAARGVLRVKVLQRDFAIFESSAELKLDAPRPAQYLCRLDLLPGSYRVMVEVDGNTFPYPFEIPSGLGAGALLRVSEARRGNQSSTPFEFDARSYYPAEDGDYVLWQLTRPGEVVWTVRRGLEVLWRTKTQAAGIALLPLPLASLAPGKYQVEASSGDTVKYLEFENAKSGGQHSSGILVSYNANLAANIRFTSIGEQLVLRGQLKEADRVFQKALGIAPLHRTEIGLARVEALAGNWDGARARLRPILASEPRNFDALCVLAYIETELQDLDVAVELYRRALEVHDSPAVRMALAQLPR